MLRAPSEPVAARHQGLMLVAVAVLTGLGASARADDGAAPPPEEPPVVVEMTAVEPAAQPAALSPLVALHAGVAVPLTKMKVGASERLEGGVSLPVMDGDLAVLGSISSVTLSRDGGAGSAAVPGQTRWTVDQQQWVFGLGAQLKLGEATARVRPEVLLVPQLYAIRSTSYGTVGPADLGEHVQTERRLGVLVAGGGAMELGPGELVGQLGFTSSGLTGLITGDASTSGFSPTVGYRMSL